MVQAAVAAGVPAAVPAAEHAPAPPPPPSRLSVGHPAAPPRPPVSSAPRAPSRPPPRPPKQKSRAPGIIKMCVLVAILGVGAFFAIKFANGWQSDLNQKSRDAAKNSDGGEAGHIANLYEVLDATDPNRYSRYGDPGRNRSSHEDHEVPDAEQMTSRADPLKDLPLLPAAWTLDVAAAKIPEGRANGAISGTNFVVDLARLDRVSQNYVLTLRQGASATADREMLITLTPNAGESLPGHSWTVTSDDKGPKTPQVVKRWRANPKFAQTTMKVYKNGYAMKLELGPLENEAIKGKIFLALPDPEQSVVAGVFVINLTRFKFSDFSDNE